MTVGGQSSPGEIDRGKGKTGGVSLANWQRARVSKNDQGQGGAVNVQSSRAEDLVGLGNGKLNRAGIVL